MSKKYDEDFKKELKDKIYEAKRNQARRRPSLNKVKNKEPSIPIRSSKTRKNDIKVPDKS